MWISSVKIMELLITELFVYIREKKTSILGLKYRIFDYGVNKK